MVCSTTPLASDEKKYSVEWSSPSGVNSVLNQQHHNSISEIVIVVVKYNICIGMESKFSTKKGLRLYS